MNNFVRWKLFKHWSSSFNIYNNYKISWQPIGT